MQRRIYLDNNATTFLDPRVLNVVADSLKSFPGNPSSAHSYGKEAKAALNHSRKLIADYLGVRINEIVFTSGGTEGLNMIMKGICHDYKGHIITSVTEHSAVYGTAKYLEQQGCSVTWLQPGLIGAPTPEMVENAIRNDTRLIVLMAVNNETGVMTDIDSIAKIAARAGVQFLVDGVALLGKDVFSLDEGITSICFSGHKIHAPKGVGFLYLKNSVKIPSLIIGGEQESGKRGGTENLSGIIGLGEAIKVLKEVLPQAKHEMEILRNKLEQTLMQALTGVCINGLGKRICNTTNLSFEGVEGETLLARLDMEGISVSHGSACSSGALEPSRILLNMGVPRKQAKTSLRISLSRFTTEDEINQACETIIRIVKYLR